MGAESNPYWLPVYVLAALLAVVAGGLPSRPRSLLILQALLLLSAAVLFQLFIVRHVVWAYAHPFNPSDGAAVAFSTVFGWLEGLVWPLCSYAPWKVAHCPIRSATNHLTGRVDREPPYYRASHDFAPSICSQARSRSRQLILFSLDICKRITLPSS